jgi:hypothetical protein
MDHYQVLDGRFQAIPIVVPVNGQETYRYIGSRYHILQGQVQSPGWRYASIGEEEDTMDWRLGLHSQVCMIQAVQIMCWTDTLDRYVTDLWSYPQSYPEVVIVLTVGEINGYLSWGGHILYYPIPEDVSEVCGKWILCQTSMCTSQ